MDGQPMLFRKVREFFCFSIFVATAVAWVSGSFEKFLVQIEKLFYVDQNVLKPTFLDF